MRQGVHAAAAPSTSLREGWLEKYSVSAPSWQKNWRKRYIVLWGNRICWHASADSRARGELHFAAHSKVMHDDDAGSTMSVISHSGQKLVLRGPPQEMNAWHAAVERALAGVTAAVSGTFAPCIAHAQCVHSAPCSASALCNVTAGMPAANPPESEESTPCGRVTEAPSLWARLRALEPSPPQPPPPLREGDAVGL